MAEQRGFLDLYVLTVTRGVTYRLLDRPAEALMDFVSASELLKITDKVNCVVLRNTVMHRTIQMMLYR